MVVISATVVGEVSYVLSLCNAIRVLRRTAGAEPERLATRAWGMSGPVRIQEQNRTALSGLLAV